MQDVTEAFSASIQWTNFPSNWGTLLIIRKYQQTTAFAVKKNITNTNTIYFL